jgi:hypothetical protein
VFARIVTLTAREPHLCDDCHTTIHPGERYNSRVSSPANDGTGAWSRVRECGQCAARHGRPLTRAEGPSMAEDHVSTIAVDFDGVIHDYTHGWDDGSIYGDLMPGAAEGLRALMRDHAVYVHTSRAPGQVADWLRERGFETVTEYQLARVHFWTDRARLLVTDRKLPALAYLDDRAVRFTAWDRVPALLGKTSTAADRAVGKSAASKLRALADQTDNEGGFGELDGQGIDDIRAVLVDLEAALDAAAQLKRKVAQPKLIGG